MTASAQRPLRLDASMFVEALVESLRKLDPRHMWGNPVMLVVEVGAFITTIRHVHRRGGHAALVLRDRRRVAVAHGDLRQLRRGDRRGPRPGTGRRAAGHAHDDDGAARRRHRAPRGRAGPRRRRGRRDRRGDPGRRHRHRGDRVGRRVGDHRRVRAGDPRGRRRPLGGHRRYARPVRPHRRRDHAGAGRSRSSIA